MHQGCSEAQGFDWEWGDYDWQAKEGRKWDSAQEQGLSDCEKKTKGHRKERNELKKESKEDQKEF